MTRTQAYFKISDTAKRPRASPPAALPWSLQATSRVPFGQAVQIEITGQLQRKRKYDEWEQIQCDMQVEGENCQTSACGLSWARQDSRHPTSPQNYKTKAKANPHSRPILSQMLQSFLPRIPWTPHAGIGIVHIDRDLIADPIHTIEAELTETRSDPTRRYGTMSSAINNSTRMELTAAIIATYAPRPITIAIDNQAVVKGFHRGSRTEGADQATGSRDGDLWVLGERVITASGANTIMRNGSQDIRHSRTRTMAGYPGKTGEATTWPTSWLGTRVRTTTKVWPSTRRRRSRGTTSIESWYTGFTSTCSESPTGCDCSHKLSTRSRARLQRERNQTLPLSRSTNSKTEPPEQSGFCETSHRRGTTSTRTSAKH